MLAAKQRKLSGIRAVALHGVQDVVVLQAVGYAGVEVFYTIRRRAMDDTGAIVRGGVVCQIHRRSACKACVDLSEWMVEFDEVEFLSNCSRYYLTAELPSF